MSFAAQNIVDFVRGFGQRRIDNHTADLERNYLNDPQGTIAAVQQQNPSAGFKLQSYKADQDKAAADATTAGQDEVDKIIGYTHGMAPGGDPTKVLDALPPGTFTPAGIAAARALLTANPNYARASDKAVWDNQNKVSVAGPGSTVFQGTQPQYHVGSPEHVNVVGSDATGRQLVATPVGIPNGPVGAPGMPAPTVEAAPAAPAAPISLDLGAGDPYAPLVKKEGGTNPDGSGRVSPKGAAGAGQIMPNTGPEAAAAAGEVWDPARNMNDPAYSIKLGRAYHAVQIGRFGGDMGKAAAAYNAGPGRVARASTKLGARYLSGLPAETQDYVRAAAPGFYGGAAAPDGSRVLMAQPPVSAATLTPKEVESHGFAPGTVVDRRTLKVLQQPPKGGAKGSDPVTSYAEARSGLLDLSNQLDKITNDSDIGTATGLRGSIERHIPGTAAQRVVGNIATAKGQALAAAVNHLKALGGGNLGFRMTQQEANAFGNSMGGAMDNTSQATGDYTQNLQAGKQRIQEMVQRMDADAMRLGYATRLKDGTIITKGQSYKGHVYQGGPGNDPTSWKVQ